MGSETLKLPVIDFSNLEHKNGTWESVKIQVNQALEEYGCFEATFDEIPLHLRTSILDGVEQLFDLPLATKERNISERAQHGYFRHSGFHHYESLGIEDALSPRKIDSFTNLMWPKGNPSFSKNLQSYTEKLSEFDHIVRKMVLECFELEKYIEDHINSTTFVVRVQKYDNPPKHETQTGLIAHTDKNILTIVQQLNHIVGLEILTEDGQKWLAAHPTSPYSFFVFVGISFHAWTNGRLHCPVHRVMMSGDEARYSIALFSTMKEGSMVKAPEELVDEDHPLLYKPYDYHKFMEFYMSYDAALTSPNSLKDYCGV